MRCGDVVGVGDPDWGVPCVGIDAHPPRDLRRTSPRLAHADSARDDSSAGPLLGWPFHASGGWAIPRGIHGRRAASPVTAVFEFTRDRFWTGEPARVVREHWWAVGMSRSARCSPGSLWILVTLPVRPSFSEFGRH